MKITAFQSGKGDCLLLEGAGGERILVDGGMADAYRKFVAPALGDLAGTGARLDLVTVSHIDQDHISGVLQLFDDLVEWRVHQYQIDSGNAAHKPPSPPKPPEVLRIWHNAFHEQVGQNAGPIADMLAARAAILSAGSGAKVREDALRAGALATSTDEALRLARRVGLDQLKIPVNGEFDRKLIFVRDGQGAVELGGLALSVIGPFEEDLEKLKKKWNAWLEDHETLLKKIAREASEDEDRLGTSEVEALGRIALAQSEALGRRSRVTTPNLASIMFLVREGGKTVLLTGDGHGRDIVKGLGEVGALQNGRIHVDVLKVQHHGSEHNLDDKFCAAVTADHYLFCGNGEHHNPDTRIVRLIAESRLAAGGNARFKFWFNSSPDATELATSKAHMREVEHLVTDLETQSGGRLESAFLREGPKLEIEV